MPSKILLKTTIPTTDDDWHIGRFSLLASHLRAQGHDVSTRDRQGDEGGDDPDFAALARGEWDQLWLFAVDETGALTGADCANIEAFRKQGGGVLLTRDHMNLGACLTGLGAIGRTQHFQSANPEPDATRHCIDDIDTGYITWPNYHSGANGDVQAVKAPGGSHPILARGDGGMIATLPAHPHEGTVGVPDDLRDVAQVIACGTSKVSGAHFNLAVAVDPPGEGRAVADSSFHHLCDYNWNPGMGCPSFVSEAPGDAILRDARAAQDARDYAANIAAWLARAM